MDSRQSQPVYIGNVVNEILAHQNSFEEKGEEEWQDLELFWGEQKNRLQALDKSANPLSSSLEKHFLLDDYLNEPQDDNQRKTVKGEDNADIPTTYITEGFRPQELAVIGTYVHKDIIPGFSYKVRKNLTEEYLFDGKAKYLENVGLGYGKRLTFEGDTLNENENYFWSDSRVHGYGFTFQAISNDEIFHILDTQTGQVIGRVLVNNPSLENDRVLTTTVGELGYVEKQMAVKFSCVAILSDASNKQSLFIDDVTVRGKAIVVRENYTSKAKVSQIFLKDFIIDSCILVPEE